MIYVYINNTAAELIAKKSLHILCSAAVHRLMLAFTFVCLLVVGVAVQAEPVAETSTAVTASEVIQQQASSSAQPIMQTALAPNKASGTGNYYGNNNPGSGSHLVSVTLALVFIVALIFAVSWLIRRFSQGVFTQSGSMKLVAAMALGTRERLMLVEVGDKQILLGVTATQINSLHVFDEPVITSSSADKTSDFSRKLMSILQQKVITPAAPPDDHHSSDRSQ